MSVRNAKGKYDNSALKYVRVLQYLVNIHLAIPPQSQITNENFYLSTKSQTVDQPHRRVGEMICSNLYLTPRHKDF